MKSASFFSLARSRPVVVTAVRVTLVVGTLLAAINHGPALFRGEWSAASLLQICLTYLVPYCVSTYSSVMALRRQAEQRQPPMVQQPSAAEPGMQAQDQQ